MSQLVCRSCPDLRVLGLMRYTHCTYVTGAAMAGMTEVATDAQRRQRLADFAAADRRREEEAEDGKKNYGFVQVYPKGWARLRALIKANPAAARVYAFLAEHIDGDAGAVVVSQAVLALEFGVHRRTVIRHLQFLEKAGALVKIRVGGSVYAYALDPEEVWRSWNDKKELAAFTTRTLVRKADKGNGQVRRKLKVMMDQPELPLVETGEVMMDQPELPLVETGDKPPFLR